MILIVKNALLLSISQNAMIYGILPTRPLVNKNMHNDLVSSIFVIVLLVAYLLM